MSTKEELLLIGRLFGSPNSQLNELFNLTMIEDFSQVQEITPDYANKLRAIVVGMVGSGHVSNVAVNSIFLDKFSNLEIVAVLGVGCDHIDVNAAAQRGVTITNTPDVNTEEVADTAMGMLLGTVRQIPQADRFLRAGRWPNEMFPLTGTLRGKRLGILGLGRIGKAVARRAEPFGLDILYRGRNKQSEVPYTYYDTAIKLAAAADILMVIVPGGEATKDLVNAAMLNALGAGGVLLNVSRGSVVDEEALITALKENTISAAGLDAFVNEPYVSEDLIARDNVVLLPHIGSGTHHTRELMSQAVFQNIKHWSEENPVPNPVFPGQQT